jgi:cytochrome c551/c552
MSQGPEDKNKRCVDCHQDRIHITGPAVRPTEPQETGDKK